jgi:polar amino acid transport system substrate-binding protein
MEALWTHPGWGAKFYDEGVKPFVVCLDPSFAPFAFMNNNRMAGVDIEMAEAIANELKRPLQLRIVPFTEILPLVISGAADMGTSGISITPERAQNVLFSNSYEDSVRRILVKEDSTMDDLADLDGKRIGAEKGTTNEEFVADKLHASKIYHYDNATEGIMGILKNEIDAYIDDEGEAELAAGKYVGRIKILDVSIPAEEYGFVFRHGNSEAKNAADKVIAAKRANGDLQALFRKYISIYKTIDLNGI